MTLLNSINYNNNIDYKRPQISVSTKRKLESLGIDPKLVTSEAQALSLIASRQSEKSFEQFAVETKPVQEFEENKPLENSSSSDTSLYSAISLQAQNTRYMLGL